MALLPSSGDCQPTDQGLVSYPMSRPVRCHMCGTNILNRPRSALAGFIIFIIFTIYLMALFISLGAETIYILSVLLVSKGCHNIPPQTWWLKTTKIYSLTFLEARYPKSGCPEGHAPPDSSREGFFLAPCNFQRLQACLGLWLPNSSHCSVFTWPFPLYVFELHLLPFKDTCDYI